MGLRKRVALGGALLTAIAASLGVSEKAIALPLANQTDSQLISQSETNRPSRLNEVRAEVVDISNDGDVRVRLPNGSYRVLPNVNSRVLSTLEPGDEVLVTTVGNEVVNVAIAPTAVQQASVDEDLDEETVETVQEVEQETIQQSSESETIVQQEVTQQETTPLPVSEPERLPPAPVTSTPVTPPPAPRALW